MATYRGFVSAVQVRDDGWVEVVLQAVHGSNATQTFYIDDIDGAVEDINKRLAYLGLVRDALIRVLPVEIEYESDGERGDLISDVTIYPRPSIRGRRGSTRIEGTVVGIAITESGPTKGTSPYQDDADLAAISLLTVGGQIQVLYLDLQRPERLTAQSMLGLLSQAHRTRRPVAVVVAQESTDTRKLAATASAYSEPGSSFVLACEWLTLPETWLDYCFAFVERLGQRYESFDSSASSKVISVRVLYTTAPGQTPEGDVSDNGSFAPETREAWVHGDSPLLARLEAALREGLQVKLGLSGEQIHEVEMISPLGSAARPVWIEVCTKIRPTDPSCVCENTPTIRGPDAGDLGRVSVSYTWQGDGYFTEGIWRFITFAASPANLTIDGETPCGSAAREVKEAQIDKTSYSARDNGAIEVVKAPYGMWHAYLKGMHAIQVDVADHNCSSPFRLLAYRIR